MPTGDKQDIMTLIFIYFFLFSYGLEKVVGLQYNLVRGFSLMNLSLYLLIFVWALRAINEKKLFQPNNVNRYLLLMILIMAFSVINKVFLHEIPHISITKDIIYFKGHIDPFILFFVMFNIINDVSTCKRVLFALLLLFSITLLTAVLQKYGIAQFSNVHVHGVDEMERISGFANANEYASYLVLFIPLVLSNLLFRKELLTKITGGALFIIALMGLLVTGSRGGILSLVFSISIYLMILKREKVMTFGRTVLVTYFLVILIGSSVVFAPSGVRQMMIERFTRLATAGNSYENRNLNKATGSRLELWAGGLQLFLERPILGHGQDTIQLLMAKRFGLYAKAHNQYINYMIEFGIIGCIVYIIILLKVFKHMWKHMEETTDSWSKFLYLSYIAGFSGWTFSMLGVQLYQTTYLFWVYTAVIYRYSQLAEVKKDSFSPV